MKISNFVRVNMAVLKDGDFRTKVDRIVTLVISIYIITQKKDWKNK